VIPLRDSAFTIRDQLGQFHRLTVTNAAGGTVPAELVAGRTLILNLKGVLPSGDGQLRWAPEGAVPVASWDFIVEVD
jgi:hypothetical protein